MCTEFGLVLLHPLSIAKVPLSKTRYCFLAPLRDSLLTLPPLPYCVFTGPVCVCACISGLYVIRKLTSPISLIGNNKEWSYYYHVNNFCKWGHTWVTVNIGELRRTSVLCNAMLTSTLNRLWCHFSLCLNIISLFFFLRVGATAAGNAEQQSFWSFRAKIMQMSLQLVFCQQIQIWHHSLLCPAWVSAKANCWSHHPILGLESRTTEALA